MRVEAPRNTCAGLAIVLMSIASMHCTASLRKDTFDKVTFDVAALDDEGLVGPPGGKRSIDYEFCIPEAREAEVKAIDPTLDTQQAPGRSGCGAGQLLAIGSTHQPNHKQILARLAALDYVTRISECFYE